MHFASSTRRLPLMVQNPSRRLATRMAPPQATVPAAAESGPAAESGIGQVLGACMMIAFFLVMALFG